MGGGGGILEIFLVPLQCMVSLLGCIVSIDGESEHFLWKNWFILDTLTSHKLDSEEINFKRFPLSRLHAVFFKGVFENWMQALRSRQSWKNRGRVSSCTTTISHHKQASKQKIFLKIKWKRSTPTIAVPVFTELKGRCLNPPKHPPPPMHTRLPLANNSIPHFRGKFTWPMSFSG